VISGYVFEVIGVSPIQCSGVAARAAALRCPLLALGGLVTLLDSRAVAHGADRGYAGVRVPVAAASRRGDQAAAAAGRAVILAVHDRSYASGFPPGGLHPIGADHCPERERSRAWSAGLPRCFGRAEAQRARGLCGCRGARPKDLGTLDRSRGGLILPRRVKAAFHLLVSGIGSTLSPSLEGRWCHGLASVQVMA